MEVEINLEYTIVGGNSSIRAKGTAELPESSTSGKTKGMITKILRPPQQENKVTKTETKEESK